MSKEPTPSPSPPTPLKSPPTYSDQELASIIGRIFAPPKGLYYTQIEGTDYNGPATHVVGMDLVSALVEHEVTPTRLKATYLGQALIERGFLTHVASSSRNFVDSFIIYHVAKGLPPSAIDMKNDFVVAQLPPNIKSSDKSSIPQAIRTIREVWVNESADWISFWKLLANQPPQAAFKNEFDRRMFEMAQMLIFTECKSTVQRKIFWKLTFLLAQLGKEDLPAFISLIGDSTNVGWLALMRIALHSVRESVHYTEVDGSGEEESLSFASFCKEMHHLMAFGGHLGFWFFRIFQESSSSKAFSRKSTLRKGKTALSLMNLREVAEEEESRIENVLKNLSKLKFFLVSSEKSKEDLIEFRF